MNETPLRPTFERLADSTLNEVQSIYAQRGAEYGDSWKNPAWNTVGALCQQFGVSIPHELRRAFAFAFLVDVKYNRHTGGLKRDTFIDSIAYQAALAQELEDIAGIQRVPGGITCAGLSQKCQPNPERIIPVLEKFMEGGKAI